MKSLLIISMERENANRTRGDSCKEHPDRESSEGQTGKIFQSLHHSSVRGHRISTVGLKRMAIVLLPGCMACSGFFMNLLTYQTGWSRLACLEGGQFVRYSWLQFSEAGQKFASMSPTRPCAPLDTTN